MRAVLYGLGALALLLVSGLFCIVPRGWAHLEGRWLGGLAYFLSTRSRRTALENLRLRLGVEGEAARRIAAESMALAGAAIVDMLRAPRMTRRIVDRDLEIPPEARATIAELGSSPRGAVFACCHLGNWEFLNLCCPFFAGGRPTSIVVRPPPYPFVGRLLMWYRGRTGQKVLHRARAVLGSYALVREGAGIAMVFDVSVPPQAGAEPVEFFGVPTYTTLAPAHLAALTGASLLLCYAQPLGKQRRYRLVMERIESPPGATVRETALALTRQLSRTLEAAIRARPEAWAWWLKRWNIRPDGAPGEWPSYATSEKWFRPAEDR
jgi:KDO2-lipid IV(A) lauroyltransferase